MRWTILVLAIATTAARSAAGDSPDPMVFDSDVSELHVRASCEITGDALTIGDVLDFSRADPRLETALSKQVIRESAATPGEVVITYPQVVSRLEELGVNMSRVLVSGPYRCRVRTAGGGNVKLAADVQPIESPAVSSAAAASSTPAPLLRDAAPAPLVHDAGPATGGQASLADEITAFVRGQWDSRTDKPEVEFERGRDDFLSLTSPPFDFKIRATNGPRLGMREFKVTIQRDGRTNRTLSIFGRVRLVRNVLVAAKPLNIGAFIKPDCVTTATRIFETDEDLGIAHAESILGQRVQTFVPEGQMVRTSDLKPVDMVIRSRPVSLFSDGAVGVRLTGTALDSGGLGETVRVRIGDTRNSHHVVRGTVVGVARVQLAEQG